jgi:biopolymer transport protein TolR
MKLGNNNHDRPLSEINITPLVDVMLVLLIIFMVTAPLLSQGLDINLPQAGAPALQRSEQDFTMTIDKNGKIFLQNDPNPYPLNGLEEKLSSIFERREKKEILIRADRDVLYGTVAKAISLVKQAGIERVGMVTEEEK